MTVAELIEKLQQFPPDMRVLVDGYEGGAEDLTRVQKVAVKLNQNTESYYGPHEAYDPRDSYEGRKYGEPDCEAVLLPRGAWWQVGA